jgi:RNA polymerase-associated protein LEO1
MPNYMSMDTKPFSPETYVGPDEEEDALHHENTIKLKVENTLRWRWKKDELGQDVSPELGIY